MAADGDERKFTVADPDAPGGKRTLNWTFSSRAQCLQCHNPWARHTLAFNTLQLEGDHDFGGQRRNQLEVLRELKILVAAEDSSRRQQRSNGLGTILAGQPARFLGRSIRAGAIVPARQLRALSSLRRRRLGEDRAQARSTARRHQSHRPAADAGYIRNRRRRHHQIRRSLSLGFVLSPRQNRPRPYAAPGRELVDERGLTLIHDWIRSLATQPHDDSSLEKLRLLRENPLDDRSVGDGNHTIDELLSSIPSALALSRA